MQDLWSQAIRVATTDEINSVHDQDSAQSSESEEYEHFDRLQFEGGDGGMPVNGMNGNQNGHGANQANGEDPASAAAPARRPKKDARKIPRYESASIDEEEFQDCKYLYLFQKLARHFQKCLVGTLGSKARQGSLDFRQPQCTALFRLAVVDNAGTRATSLLWPPTVLDQILA